MKKITLLVSFIALMAFPILGISQKVAIVGMNHTTPDGIAIVALEDLPSGETFYYTDSEYSDASNAFATGEGVVQISLTSAVAKGNVIVLSESSANVLSFSCSSGCTGTATVISGNFAIATDGEGHYLYSDNDTDPTNGVTEIFCVVFTGSGETPSVNGGSIPADQDPSIDFPNAVVVDGFPNAQPDFTEFNSASRGTTVNREDLEDPTNWNHGQTNGTPSQTVFDDIEVMTAAETYDLRMIMYNDLDQDGTNNELNLGAGDPQTGNALIGWEFTVYDSSGNLVAQGTTSEENPGANGDLGIRVNFPDLISGEEYIICYTPQTNWVNTQPGASASPDPTSSGKICETITLSSNTNVTRFFGVYEDLPLGSITVLKNVDDNSFADMMFDFSFGGTPFSISENTTEGYVVENLLPGNYEITELIPNEWDLVSINAGNGNNNTALVNGLTVVLEAGENAVVTFNNVYTPLDNTPPVITSCPEPIEMDSFVSNDECGDFVDWEPPLATDNLPGVTLTSNYEPGDLFPFGTTEVIYTATDAAGNQAVCKFMVTVNDKKAPTPICINGLTATLDVTTGIQTIVATDFIASPITDPCGEVTYTISRATDDSSADVRVPGLTLSCNDSDITTVRIWAEDVNGNSDYCETYVLVDKSQFNCPDVSPPVITCPADVTVEYGASTSFVDTGSATANDDTDANPIVTFSDSFSTACGSTGTITRTWTATDESGKSSTCEQTITIVDKMPPGTTTPPADVIVQCEKDIPLSAELYVLDTSGHNPNGPVSCNYSLPLVVQGIKIADVCVSYITYNGGGFRLDIKYFDESLIPSRDATDVLARLIRDNFTAMGLSNGGRGWGPEVVEVNGSDGWFEDAFVQSAANKCGIVGNADIEADLLSGAQSCILANLFSPDYFDSFAGVDALNIYDLNGIIPGISIVGIPNDEFLEGETPDTYKILRTWTFTDACGNDSSVSQTITVNSPPTVEITGKDSYCHDGNGVVLDAGAGFASYLWSPGGETTQTITALEGSYTVTVTNGFGCEATSEAFIVTNNEPLTCNIVQDVLTKDHETEDGVATVYPVGGTGQYTYLWDNGETGQTATTLTYGMHSVMVTDANGCETTCQIDIAKELYCWTNLIQNVSIRGGTDGAARVSGNGGYMPFTYVWDDGSTDQTNNSLTAGVHFVTITDATGATSQCSVTITEPTGGNCDSFLSTVEQDQLTTDHETEDGVATVYTKGGTAPFNYLWDNGETTKTATKLTYGLRTVTVTDANGCETSSQIDIAKELYCWINLYGNVTVRGGSDGSAKVHGNGGYRPFTYQWDDDTTERVNNKLSAGTHYVTITDAKGATSQCSITITEPNQEICDGVDNDGDGMVDEGFDQDGDGIADCYDKCDDRIDSDGDGTPDCTDQCDDTIDSDGDGIPDCTDPCDDRIDSDGDGTPDCTDQCDDTIDSDGDGIPDCTDPCDDTIDLDGDGTPDCTDQCDDTIDSDGDGTPDCTDQCDDTIDSDGDGIPDCTDPCDDRIDSDGDGTPDCTDQCDDTIDSDGDGTPDCTDQCDDTIDSDGDGTPDCTDPCDDRIDSDGDGTPDCTDECDDTIDSDGDGIPDCTDECDDTIDTDGDGISDCQDVEECDGLDNDGDGLIDEGLDCDTGTIDQCETAYARSADENVRTCFLDLANVNGNNWGWTNEFPSINGTYQMDLYAAAGQCDISKGALVGNVQVVYNNGSVDITVSTLSGYKMTEAQLHVGTQVLPTQGNGFTSAPGQYAYKYEPQSDFTNYTFEDIGTGDADTFYVVLHANVCPTESITVKRQIANVELKGYPIPFKNDITIEVLSPSETKGDLYLYGALGQKVWDFGSHKLRKGKNEIGLSVGELSPGMYFIHLSSGYGTEILKVLNE